MSIFRIIAVTLILLGMSAPGIAAKLKQPAERPSTEHEVHFSGTSYELHVYRVYGRQDGNTMLIIGGIQGDEPGGFLSADLYSDLTLERGNLIVIPRANLKSIILFDRGSDGDMNRRFDDTEATNDMDRVVGILKSVMSEADVFLNMHDGWGFHNPEYIDKWRNPYRFGQSIITDGDTFTCDDGNVLDLKGIADPVLKDINSRIDNEDHHLHYFNTETDDPRGDFPEMKKTATWYALTTYCLPSFGVESSKNLPTLEMKVLHHNYAVNAFMAHYDIQPEHPRVFLPRPELSYAVVLVNSSPRIVDNNGTISVHKGDRVEITHIDANYERGISCDILGHDDLNDFRKPIEITADTRVVFRKDNAKMGEISIKLLSNGNSNYSVFLTKVDDRLISVVDGETLDIPRAGALEIIGLMNESGFQTDVPVNFKGYVPPGITRNTGDDRGYAIRFREANFISGYSKNGTGRTYPVVAGTSSSEYGRFWVRIID